MKGIIMYWYLLLASLEMMSLISVTPNRPSTSYPPAASHQVQIPRFPQASSDSKQKKAKVEVVSGTDEGTYKVLSRLGSRPPSCKHKCQGCIPYNAIQIPAAISGQMRLHYTNYGPEGWKYKCGSSFFNP